MVHFRREQIAIATGRPIVKSLAVLLGVLLFSGILIGQEPTAAAKLPGASSSTGVNQLFVGYNRVFNDWGNGNDSGDFNGISVSYTRLLSKHFGALGSFEFNRNGQFDGTYYATRAGARYNILTRRFRPYVVGSLGGAHLKDQIFGSLPDGTVGLASHSWFGFTAGGGGGVDFNLTQHLGARAEYGAYRVPFGAHLLDRDIWTELTVGGVFRW